MPSIMVALICIEVDITCYLPYLSSQYISGYTGTSSVRERERERLVITHD